MAAEIYSNDGLVLADNAAWHGLGTVVKGAPNPFAALRIAGMEWTVEESDTLTGIYNPGEDDEYRVSTDGSKMLVRSDDHSVLAVVGGDYQPIQNTTLADLAYGFRLAGDSQGVEVESAGSIRGGRKVWMLLRAPSVDMTGRGDIAQPYLMIGNSHDGTMALRVLPTSVRVVCSNTFHAALSGRAGWSFRHTLNIGTKVESLATDIKRWFSDIDNGRKIATAMATKQVNRETVRNLWSDVLTQLDGEIPAAPSNGWELNRKEKAVAFLAHAAQTFDRESQEYGANLWTATNAATSAIQHLRAGWAVRTKDAAERKYAAWVGQTAEATADAFAIAGKMM
jgi:phage/plasmid-like protein (TIGR03299 family)